MSKINYVKKLSIKTMNALPSGIKDQEAGTRTAVAHFIGRADGVETGSTSFGDYTALTGIFKGVNLETGEIFRASKCFLPDIAVDDIAARLADIAEEGGAVEFALEIGIVRDIKLDAKGNETGIGYSYTMSPLIEPDQAQDPLALIESRIQPMLEAPKDPESDTPAEPVGSKSARKR